MTEVPKTTEVPKGTGETNFSHMHMLKFISDNTPLRSSLRSSVNVPNVSNVSNIVHYESGVKIKGGKILTDWVNYKFKNRTHYKNVDFITNWIRNLNAPDEKQVLHIYHSQYRCKNVPPNMWFGYKNGAPTEFYIGKHSFARNSTASSASTSVETITWEDGSYDAVPNIWKSILGKYIKLSSTSVFIKNDPHTTGLTSSLTTGYSGNDSCKSGGGTASARTYYISYIYPITTMDIVSEGLAKMLLALQSQLQLTDLQIQNIIKYIHCHKNEQFARIAVSSSDPSKLSIYFTGTLSL